MLRMSMLADGTLAPLWIYCQAFICFITQASTGEQISQWSGGLAVVGGLSFRSCGIVTFVQLAGLSVKSDTSKWCPLQVTENTCDFGFH